MIYTGIGSRETPQVYLDKMSEIAWRLGRLKWVLRSGGAPGADTFFEIGHCSQAEFSGIFSSAEIFLPWSGFENRGKSPVSITAEQKGYVKYIIPDQKTWLKCFDLASKIHPAWNQCKQGSQKLHGRNICQLLGEDLETPADMVVCWTKGGMATGGTATAINLAKSRGIPVYNLANHEEEKAIMKIIELDNWPEKIK